MDSMAKKCLTVAILVSKSKLKSKIFTVLPSNFSLQLVGQFGSGC